MPWLDPNLPQDAAFIEPTPQAPSLPRLLRVGEVAAWLGRSPRTVMRMIGRGEVPAVRLGVGLYVREADLLDAIDARIRARLNGGGRGRSKG